MRRAISLPAVLALGLSAAAPAAQDQCTGTVYLTIDTGSMSQAENIAATLRKHQVKATFFVANEKTIRNDFSLGDPWAAYWRARVAEGHAFGSHTWRHWYFRKDQGAQVAYVSTTGQRELLDAAGVCAELRQADEAFKQLTGRALDPIWRAPGGKTTPNTDRYAAQCGYGKAVGWTPAGFLGDELPSESYSNDMLLKRALANTRDGEILLMHTGIRSRKDPFAPMLDPLIGGLKARGFCFDTIKPGETRS